MGLDDRRADDHRGCSLAGTGKVAPAGGIRLWRPARHWPPRRLERLGVQLGPDEFGHRLVALVSFLQGYARRLACLDGYRAGPGLGDHLNGLAPFSDYVLEVLRGVPHPVRGGNNLG